MNGRTRYRAMRSILEVPPLVQKYVDKIPQSAADAVMLDLEDSIPANDKTRARERVLEAVKDRAFFGDRTVVVRVNNLQTDWGGDDIDALAEAGDGIVICYPKVEDANEMREVANRVGTKGANIGLYPMVETVRAVQKVDEILSCDGLVGVHFGYSDFANELGCTLFNANGDDLHDAMNYPRSAIAVSAAAHGLFSTGGSKVPDHKDFSKVAHFVNCWAAYGYTACIALSPSHVEIVNHAFRPTDDELDDARIACAAFEAAIAAGENNVIVEGRVITLPDYRKAKDTLSRAEF